MTYSAVRLGIRTVIFVAMKKRANSAVKVARKVFESICKNFSILLDILYTLPSHSVAVRCIHSCVVCDIKNCDLLLCIQCNNAAIGII